MAGLRHGFRWNATGIAAKLGGDLDSALRYLKEVHGFSVAVSEFLRAVGNVELLHGQMHTVTVPAGLSFFPHSLGRPYIGILILGYAPSTQTPPRPCMPAEVTANDRDPAKVFGIRANIVGDLTMKAWVF